VTKALALRPEREEEENEETEKFGDDGKII
jgi:hypothetical protein